jgi:glycosyltransferase 2 family protein
MTAYAAASTASTPTAVRPRRRWMWARLIGGGVILLILVWRVGTGPFLDGVRMIDGWSLAAAFMIGAVTTVCCAWRWSLVGRGLGVEVPLRVAIPAYYRSQFLNTTLPGGVVGDVHRAVSHGRDVGNVSGGVRAVAWERSAGQVVQIVLTVVVLLLLPSPARSSMPIVAGAIVVGAVALAVIARTLPQSGPSRWVRALRMAVSDLRDGLLSRRAWPGIVAASAVVVIGSAATFMIAARTAGLAASPVRMIPLALLVLLAMAVPLSIAGWGPREGAAAWVFGAAGLGAAAGVTTAVVYGVLVLVSTLPGAIVLLVAWLRRPTTVVGADDADER